MEAFEAFAAVALESEGYVVSEAVKFPVTLQTKKAAHAEIQTHGYEVDLVGARRDRLVLATVQHPRSDEMLTHGRWDPGALDLCRGPALTLWLHLALCFFRCSSVSRILGWLTPRRATPTSAILTRCAFEFKRHAGFVIRPQVLCGHPFCGFPLPTESLPVAGRDG
jgi:hypothetical protein